jgi:hypothetical protein
MMAIGILFVGMLCDCLKSRRRLEAEILVLRHQVNILQQRGQCGGLHLRWVDRVLFIWLYRALASKGLCRLLAMAVPLAWGPAADRQRRAGPDPKNEF